MDSGDWFDLADETSWISLCGGGLVGVILVFLAITFFAKGRDLRHKEEVACQAACPGYDYKLMKSQDDEPVQCFCVFPDHSTRMVDWDPPQ